MLNVSENKTKNTSCALVVDDEESIREIICDFLKDRGYKVYEANNGKEALDVLKEHPDINLIFSDIKMPVMDGMTLFLEIKKFKYPPDFILLTGFTDVLNMETAYNLGVNEFIEKPFTQDDLLTSIELIEHSRSGLDTKAQVSIDLEYCRVHIDDFTSGSNTPADVYLKIGTNKYLRVAKKDTPLALDRVENYKSKGLNYLFLKKEDFADYVGMNVALSKAISKAKAPKRQKLQVLKHSLDVMVQSTYINSMDKEKYNECKDMVESTLNLVLSQKELFDLLNLLKTHSKEAYDHSLAVSLYACAVCNHWGWRSTFVLNKIIMTGLFHDIGTKELPPELLLKARINMTKEELKLYESHTSRGAYILSQTTNIPEDVVTVALQHHETIRGTGYPNKLNRMRIHPLAKIIGTVDLFVDNIFTQGEKADVKITIDTIYKIMKEDVDLQTLKALMEIFSYPIPNDLKSISKPNMILK
jgi:putative nucleotidyltransferase with HDIG domain